MNGHVQSLDQTAFGPSVTELLCSNDHVKRKLINCGLQFFFAKGLFFFQRTFFCKNRRKSRKIFFLSPTFLLFLSKISLTALERTRQRLRLECQTRTVKVMRSLLTVAMLQSHVGLIFLRGGANRRENTWTKKVKVQ